MRVLLDTNAVVYTRLANSPHHAPMVRLLDQLLDRDAVLCVCPQVLYELWVVATRPEHMNGLGLTPDYCDELLQEVLDTFEFVPEPMGLVEAWRRICVAERVIGKRAHDARMAAFVQAAGLDGLVTADAGIGFGIEIFRPVGEGE